MAVSKTPRFGLTRWTEDEDPWSRDDWDDDNAAVEALAAIARTGTYATRGSAATYARSLFYATDQTSLWFSDGATWRRLELPNFTAWPNLASIPRGSALTPLDGPQVGISGQVLFHSMPLPGGATVDSIAVARGIDGTNELYTKHAWVAVYDALTGNRLAVTQDVTGQQFFHNYTLTMQFAAPWQVPKSGRYMIVLHLSLQTAANVETQAKLSGAPMPATLSNTGSIPVAVSLDTPAEAPANSSEFGGYVQIHGAPWFGFSLST